MSEDNELKDECRLCLAEINNKDFTHIFPAGQTTGVPLITKIMVCVSLTVREEDDLPKKICKSCEQRLDIFYAFRQTCWEAFLILSQNHSRSKRVDSIESQLACITGTELDTEKISNERKEVESSLRDATVPFKSNSKKRALENNQPEIDCCKSKSVSDVQNQEDNSEDELERLLSSSEHNDNKCDTDPSREMSSNRMDSDENNAEKHEYQKIPRYCTDTTTVKQNLDKSCAKENCRGKVSTETELQKTESIQRVMNCRSSLNDNDFPSTVQMLENGTNAAEIGIANSKIQQSVKSNEKDDKKDRNKGKSKNILITDTAYKQCTRETKDEVAKKSDDSEWDMEKKIPQHHIVCIDANDRYIGEVLIEHQTEVENNPKSAEEKHSRVQEPGVDFHSHLKRQILKQIMLSDDNSERNSENSEENTEAFNDQIIPVEEETDQTLDDTLPTTIYLQDSMEDCCQVEEILEQVLQGDYLKQSVKYKCLRCENIFNDLDTVTVHYIECCQSSKRLEVDDNGSDDSPDYMENIKYLHGNLVNASEKLNDDKENGEAQESISSNKDSQKQQDKFISSSRSLKLQRLNLSLKEWKVSSKKNTSISEIDQCAQSNIRTDTEDVSNNSEIHSVNSDIESDASNINAEISSRCHDAGTENNSVDKPQPVTLVTCVRVRKRKGRPSKTDHPCPDCDSVFSSAALLKRHTVVHTGERPYECEICNKRFTQIGQLNFHRNFHENPRYRCEICNKPFLRPSDIEKHMRTHTGEKPFQCKECSRSFAQLAALQQHKRIHTGDKPYTCEICGKSFSQKANKTKHVKIHKEGERPHTCEVCGRSYSELKEMELHRAGHGGGKPRKCDHCEESFRKVSELNLHIQKFHTFERPHKCMFCPKAFYSVYNLKQHVMVHTGQRPFACPKCDLRFTQKSNLTKHFERKHPEFALEKDGYVVDGEEAYDGEDMIIIERNITEKMSYPLNVEREETVELVDDLKQTDGNIQILAIAQ